MFQAPMVNDHRLVRLINSSAPTRICDNGGWTDTWFAQYGSVFNIAISPVVEVQLSVFREAGNLAPLTINALNFKERYSIEQPKGFYGKHPLIEAVCLTACLYQKGWQSNYPFSVKHPSAVPSELRPR